MIDKASGKIPIDELLEILQVRFEKNKTRHPEISWESVAAKLFSQPDKLWSFQDMVRSGGEPDVVAFPTQENSYVFMGCSKESPKGRRSLCFDAAALASRKDFPPENNAQDMATAMGIHILTEVQYRFLQKHGPFDSKTSSWLETPKEIRQLGGAIFGDNRYENTFIYHNGAGSYYAARGFRGILLV